MQSFVVFALCLVAALAAPPSTSDRDAQIVAYSSDNIGVDGYKFDFQTSNGISQEENAQLKNVGTENEALEVRGQFSYTGPDGVVYTVTYVANENGYQASGPHLPVPPQ